jgi:hypothetical protein
VAELPNNPEGVESALLQLSIAIYCQLRFHFFSERQRARNPISGGARRSRG